MVRAATRDPRDVLESVQEPVEALQPMAVGGLTTLVVLNALAADPSHALHTVEHALLAYFVADLGLELAVEGRLSGPVRWFEAAVLVPYAALVLLGALSVVACGDGLLAPLRAVLYDLHGGLALCRGLLTLDVVAGAGVLAVVGEFLPGAAHPEEAG